MGLFRSEFLYLRALPRSPGVQEQRRAYETLLEAAAPHPVVIRTYDLGGEKGIGPAPGDNPALGLRGLRYCLAHPELFLQQLTALCQASRKGKLRILLPMVTSLSELKAARRLLEKAAARCGLTRVPELGVMIEVPSAALMADRLASRPTSSRSERTTWRSTDWPWIARTRTCRRSIGLCIRRSSA